MKKFLDSIRNRSVLFKGLLFSLFSFFNQGVSFVLLIILANFIAPGEYGQLSLYNTVVMFIGYFIVLSSDGYLSISYFNTTRSQFRSDVSSVLLILCIMTFVFVGIDLVFINVLPVLLKLSNFLILLSILSCFCQVLVNINLNIYRIKENVITYGLLSCSFALCNFVLTLILVISFDRGWMGRVESQVYCLIVFSILALMYFYKERLFTIRIDKYRLKSILFWGIPLIPHLATTWLRQGCDRYIIDYNYTLNEVGLFSFALNLANVIEVVGVSFNSTNSVNIFKILSNNESSGSEKKNELSKLSKEVLLIYIAASILVLLGGVFLIPIVMPSYAGAVPYFMILAIYGFFRCVYYIYCNYLFYWSKNQWLMYITIGASILHLLLSLILTRYSLFITAFLYCLSQILIDIALYFLANRLITKNLNN